MSLTTEATKVWKHLNGVFCVYKPMDITMHQLRKSILTKICNDLNQLDVRPPKPYVAIEGDTSQKLVVQVRESFSDNVLVAGKRYISDDVRLNWATYLGKKTSGVALFGINDGCKSVYKFHFVRPLRTYKVSGVLGKVTDNMYIDGKALEKAKFDHVTQSIINKILQSYQAAHQKSMFTQSGVDIQSQTAYEMAIQGAIRPANSKVPVIYGLKCVLFEPPYFTIEIHCVNENENYLLSFVHDIGLKCRTLATCTRIQCIRHSFFGLEESLLRKHWTVQHIIDNINLCQTLMKQNDTIILETPLTLMEPNLDKSFLNKSDQT